MRLTYVMGASIGGIGTCRDVSATCIARAGDSTVTDHLSDHRTRTNQWPLGDIATTNAERHLELVEEPIEDKQ